MYYDIRINFNSSEELKEFIKKIPEGTDYSISRNSINVKTASRNLSRVMKSIPDNTVVNF